LAPKCGIIISIPALGGAYRCGACQGAELGDDEGMRYVATAAGLLVVSVATWRLDGRVPETLLIGLLLLSIATVLWVWRR